MSKKLQYFKQIILSALLVVGFVTVATPLTATVNAAVDLDPCTLDAKSALCKDKNNSIDSVFKIIVNTLLFIIGAVAVVVIIVSGIRYTISGGNQNSVTAAKNTLIYAIVGLVVAIFAWAIVNFVIDRAMG